MADQTIFDTVAEMEALKRSSSRERLLICKETGKAYYFEADGGSYTRNGTTILNTGLGGSTRFLATS